MSTLTYAEALQLLCAISGWKRSEVEADPSSALWAASGRLVEARNTIRDARRAQT